MVIVTSIGYCSLNASHTALHEFGHAAEEERNGRITDIYHGYKNQDILNINKKKNKHNRPNQFAIYNGNFYLTDQFRNGTGYETGWSSFHPEGPEPKSPNIMGN